MKFWRNTSVAALAVAFSASTAFAAIAPKAPAAATGAMSCQKNTTLTEKDGLVMCVEFEDFTQGSWGNGFPWENSTFFFATTRNQYLYPSSTVNDVKAVTQTMKGIGARAVSFSGNSTNVYASGSSVRVTNAVADTLQTTFSLNPGTTSYCTLNGPFTITHRPMPSGRPGGISTCSTCPAGPFPDSWCQVGPTLAAFNAVSNILVDINLVVGTGSSGGGVWDMTTTSFGEGCDGPQRAYGSGSFVNSQHLTTAYGVDSMAFVWVFRGTAMPPPATVEQQIKEIVRLLLTPEGLRCSGLDLKPGNGIIQDEPFSFPNGSRIDPIQPQISTGGTVTGDELVDNLRKCGWSCN